jgi:hypothetical protein
VDAFRIGAQSCHHFCDAIAAGRVIGSRVIIASPPKEADRVGDAGVIGRHDHAIDPLERLPPVRKHAE